MAKKGEFQADKHRDGDPNKKLLSKIEADRRYNQKLYCLNLRMPKDYKDKILAYINGYNAANPDKPIESINKWIMALIVEKLGIEPDEKN